MALLAVLLLSIFLLTCSGCLVQPHAKGFGSAQHVIIFGCDGLGESYSEPLRVRDGSLAVPTARKKPRTHLELVCGIWWLSRYMFMYGLLLSREQVECTWRTLQNSFQILRSFILVEPPRLERGASSPAWVHQTGVRPSYTLRVDAAYTHQANSKKEVPISYSTKTNWCDMHFKNL